MDNLWVYLILIFGYVGYSLVKSARKQREESQQSSRALEDEQEALPIGDDELLRLLQGEMPSLREKKGVARQTAPAPAEPLPVKKKPAPFLPGELSQASKPAREARESFLRKVSQAKPGAVTPATGAEYGGTPVVPPPAEADANEESRPEMTIEEWRKAVIASEILNRKY